MKTVVFLVILAIVVVGIVAVVFPSFKDLVGQAHSDIEQLAKDKLHADYLVNKAKEEIKEQREGLTGDYLRLIMGKREMESISNKRVEMQASIEANDEQIINGLQILTEQTGSEVTTPKGVVYARAHLKTYVDSLAIRNDKDRIWLETLTAQEAGLVEAIRFAEENFNNAKLKLDEMEIEIDRMGIMAAAAQSYAEVQTLCDSLKGVGSGSGDSRFLTELRRRLDEFEAKRIAKLPARDEVPAIDLSSENAPASRAMSPSERYAQEYLGRALPTPPAAAPAVPAPTNPIDLSVPAAPAAQ